MGLTVTVERQRLIEREEWIRSTRGVDLPREYGDETSSAQRNQTQQENKRANLEIVRAMLGRNSQLTGRRIHEITGINERTAYRLLRDARGITNRARAPVPGVFAVAPKR
jgi:hypothetical protein